MKIQISSKPLCTISVTMLPDVYQLLGMHSFTFHLDKENGTLNIVNPLSGHQVVLESKCKRVKDRLLMLTSEALRAAGLQVWIVDTEEERKACLSELNGAKPSIWLSVLEPEPDENKVTAHFFVQQMKSSKQLAHLLIQNIVKLSDLPVGGVSLNWKKVTNYISPLSGHNMPMAALTYGRLSALSPLELEQLSRSIVCTATSFFAKQPVLDLIRTLQWMEHAGLAAQQETADSVVAEQHSVMETVESGPAGAAADDAGQPTEAADIPDVADMDGHMNEADETDEEKEVYEAIEVNKEKEVNEVIEGIELIEGIEGIELNEENETYENDETHTVAASDSELLPETVLEASEENEAEAVHIVTVDIEPEERSDSERQAESGSEPIAEEGQDTRSKQAPTYSTFIWLQAQTVRKERGPSDEEKRRNTSFFSYMNQMSQKQEKKQAPKPFDMMTLERERAQKS
ncbi:hypothetical protein M3650_05955 [Paenibacillus sp. MER TA 81-3]|uniref:hypothetical protein n=1 Tax=Paenibacillus sp. MER TA 81-3 TaxID=2939573 RepID=UPI002042461A|nr:hypothetical protein [Paenibacillus sp. MER TA 81-3]MCM3338190.1 hypothetical protein [Paenibacillus sp. MER TA 81-3]